MLLRENCTGAEPGREAAAVIESALLGLSRWAVLGCGGIVIAAPRDKYQRGPYQRDKQD